MLNISFYILADSHAKAHFNLACRLIEKAYKNRHRIYVHTENQTDAHYLDELLWTYREDSFLPHHLYGEGPEPAPPIQLGCGITPEKHRDVLINLSHEVPMFYTQFARIIEIIPSDAILQERGREHYRHYRTQGHPITTHKLEATIE